MRALATLSSDCTSPGLLAHCLHVCLDAGPSSDLLLTSSPQVLRFESTEQSSGSDPRDGGTLDLTGGWGLILDPSMGS